MKKIKQICAWCKQLLGEVDVLDTDPGGDTHGICDSCREEHFGEVPKVEPPSEGSGGEKRR